MRFVKTAFYATISLFIFFVLSSHAADVAKIGVVDLQRLLMTSDAGKAAQYELKKKGTAMEVDIKQKGGELEDLKNRFEREALVMNRDNRMEKEREYRIKVNDFKTLKQKYMAELKDLETQLVSHIRKDIIIVIEELGKKEGYLLIVDKAVAHYSPKAIEITDTLIQLYNETNKKKDSKN